MAIINEEYAKENNLTITEAYVISHMACFISFHIQNNQNRFEGNTWNRTTEQQFSDALGFGFSRRKVQNVFNSLIEKNVLKRDKFNKHGFDQTWWYAFVNEDKVLEAHSHRKYKPNIVEVSNDE